MSEEEFIAKARAENRKVSRKHCVEIGRWIKNDSVEKAKEKLKKVINKEKPVPYTKFNKDLSHKKGMAAGRYPVKSAKEMLKILKSAEENGKYEGLSDMKVSNVVVTQGRRMRTPKRQRGRSPKSAHINIEVKEIK